MSERQHSTNPLTHTHTDKNRQTIRHSFMLQLAQHSTTVKYFIHNKVIFFFKKSFLIYNTIFDKTTPFTAKFELLSSSFSHNQSKHVDDGGEKDGVKGTDEQGSKLEERMRKKTVREREGKRKRTTLSMIFVLRTKILK